MRAGALLALLLAALLIGGCGGGEDSGGSSTEATVAQESKGATSDGDGGAEAEEEGEGDGQSRGGEGSSVGVPNPQIATERVPGSKAVAPGVPTTEGGDNSIQAFGLEGEEEAAAQAVANLRAYLSARVDGDWAAACAAASEEFRSQLETLIEQRAKAKDKEEGAQEPEGCPETLELLYGKAPSRALREAAAVKQVLSLRVREDGYAYLIYEDAAGEVRFIAMANDNGAWKVNTTEPTGFPETEEQGSPQ